MMNAWLKNPLKNPLLVDTEEVELQVVEQLEEPELEQVIRKYQLDLPSETQAEKLRRISNQHRLDRVILFGCGCIVTVNGEFAFLLFAAFLNSNSDKFTYQLCDYRSHQLCFSRVALLFGSPPGSLIYIVLISGTIRFLPTACIDGIET